MDTPLISIIVPTYNRYDMLRGALESLIHQETEGELSYELIVVDNASTDDTKALVEDVAAEAPVRVRYLYEETPGPGAARNCGLAHAQGEWIAFFDDDDVPAPAQKGKPKTAQVSGKDDPSKQLPAFAALTAEQKKFVESQHDLAFSYYKNRDYDKAIFEIEKIFALVSETAGRNVCGAIPIQTMRMTSGSAQAHSRRFRSGM